MNKKQLNINILLIIILMVTALIYARTLQNGLLSWDDRTHVTDNKDIQSLSVHNIKAIFTSYYVRMYHPLVTLSFAIEYHCFKLNPIVYHATNVLFHLANVVLVFYLVLSLSKRRETAFIAACLFGIHPMHVESVAWIAERKDVVYAFFYLCAMFCYTRFIQREQIKYYWMTCICFVLSLFSKTTAVTFPIVLFLIDYYFHRKVTVRTLLEKLPLFALSLVFGLIAFRSQGVSAQNIIGGNFNFIDRLFLASYSLSYYFIHLFAPFNLSALHLMPIKIQGMLPVEYYLAVILPLILAFVGTRKRIFRREYVFGLLFFIVILSVNIHIIPVGMSVVSERYTYLAYVGLYYIIGQLYCYLFDRYQHLLFSWKKVIIIGAALIAIFFGYLTYQRIGVWKSASILFQDAATKTSKKYEANFIQGLSYRFEGDEKVRTNLYKEAIECFDKAIVLIPQNPGLYVDRGMIKFYLKEYMEAMKDYEKAIELNPLFAPAYSNRASIYLIWNKQKEACTDLLIAYKLGMHNVFEMNQVDCY